MRISVLVIDLMIVASYCYVNPVQGARDSPDPGVVYDGHNYYAVTT